MPAWKRTILVAVLLACPAFAQEPNPPEPAPVPCVATAIVNGPRESKPGDLIILDASQSKAKAYTWTLVGSHKPFLPVDGGVRLVFASGDAGTYTFVLSVAQCDTVAVAVHEVTIGKPEPPAPPDPEPEPDPGPVPLGAREILIFRESANDTTAQGIMFTSLQAGAQSAYIAQRGHSVFVLDVDAVDADKKTAKIVEAWKAQLTGATLPMLFIVEKGSRKVLHKGTLSADATADSVVELLKKNGG